MKRSFASRRAEQPVERHAVVLFLVLALAGCLAKKKPTAQSSDAEATPVASAAAVDEPPVAAPLASDPAPLAPLATTVAPKPVAAKPHPPTANPNAAGCSNARLFCGHPAVNTDPAMKARCDGFTADCIKAGGKL